VRGGKTRNPSTRRALNGGQEAARRWRLSSGKRDRVQNCCRETEGLDRRRKRGGFSKAEVKRGIQTRSKVSCATTRPQTDGAGGTDEDKKEKAQSYRRNSEKDLSIYRRRKMTAEDSPRSESAGIKHRRETERKRGERENSGGKQRTASAAIAPMWPSKSKTVQNQV